MTITKRTIQNEFRDPTAFKGKVFQVIFYALLSLVFFERIATNKNSFIQNIMGLLFYFALSISVPATFGTLEVFSVERPIFIRECQNNTYNVTAYFFARIIAYIPQEIILPFIFTLITYFSVHLNETVSSLFICYLTLFLISWMGSAYGLFLSAIFTNL